MRQVTALNNQSLFDIAIQEYGTIEAVFDLAMANGLSVTDTLTAGQVLNVPEVDPAVVQPEIVDYYRRHGIRPATGETEVADTPVPAPTGGDCEWIIINN